MNKTHAEVQAELRRLYKLLDSKALLYWSHEDRVTGKRLRSENTDSSELDYKNLETAQVGYGEIALGSTQQLFNIMMHCSSLIYKEDELRQSIVGAPEEYNLTEDSLFLDIGSGFGKPNFHAALLCGCRSVGVEIVPVRAKVSEAFLYDYREDSQLEGKDEQNEREYLFKAYNCTSIAYIPAQTDDIALEYLRRPKQPCILEGESADHVQIGTNSSDFCLNRLLHAFIKDETVPGLEVLSMVECDFRAVDLIEFMCIMLCNPAAVEYEVNMIVKSIEETYRAKAEAETRKQKKKSKKESKIETVKREENKLKPIFNQIQVKSAMNTQYFKYKEEWLDEIKFLCCDATAGKAFADEDGSHFTHIYSYNKLMSAGTRKKIAKVLNKTKFKLLAWYSNARQTEESGLKNVKMLCKFPMQSTSTEKFHIYVYIRVKHNK